MRWAIAVLPLVLLGCAAAPEDNAVTDPPVPQMKKDFITAEYPSANGRSIPMDTYLPTKSNLHRAVILIHGGGWVSGGRGDMASIARFFAEHGFTAISIDYSLAPAQIWPAQLEDVQAAVRYVRSNAKKLDINPGKIAAAGISAGGHLSMLLGVKDNGVSGVSSKVQAVGSISGIHDLNAPLTKAGDQYKIVETLLRETGKPNKELRKEASPISFVDKSSAPVFFIQGSADPLVPQSQSDLAIAALEAAHIEARFELVEGMGHGLTPSPPAEKAALENLAAWLSAKLK